jgi:hypothetical protein
MKLSRSSTGAYRDANYLHYVCCVHCDVSIAILLSACEASHSCCVAV